MSSLRAVCLLTLATVACSACATAPSVGVRGDYTRHTIRRVAVAPVTATSRFGLEDSEWQTVRATYERQTLKELRRFGFRVLPPERLEHQLRQSGDWQTFTEVLVRQGELSSRFEPSLYGDDEPLEVIALKKLSADSALQADAILITEIVYQSVGTCDVDPRAYSRHAIVIGDPDRPSPCVVSHFEAKLVDPSTGTTMWHNRQLRERRVDHVDREVRMQNIRETVTDTISGAHGVGPLATSG